MAADTPIPPISRGFFRWLRTPQAPDKVIENLNKLCALEIAFGGKRFPVRFAGENALIDLKETVVSSTSALPAISAYSVLANPTATSATPVATVSPILTSVQLGASGGILAGTSGALTLTASGSNKDITLTPSGTGRLVVPKQRMGTAASGSPYGGTIELYGIDDATTYITSYRAGNDAFSPAWLGAKSRGTLASPAATNSGDALFSFTGGGYDTAWREFACVMTMRAAQSWSSGNNGTEIEWGVTPNGSATRGIKMRLTNAGFLVVNGSSDDGTNALQVTGSSALHGGAIIDASGYLNFGATAGSGGYGIRDSAGSMQFKNSAGAWTSLGAGSGSPGGSDTQLQYNATGAFGGISGATSNGTSITITAGNLIATSPKFITGLNDTNGNELFLLTATASAVNEITVANAATGAGPFLSATGGDTNIDFSITPKGTGSVVIPLLRMGTASAGVTTGAINVYGATDETTYINTHRAAADAFAPTFVGAKSRGSLASPTATQSGDGLFAFAGGGYGTSWYEFAALFAIYASETWSGSVRGTEFRWDTTANGGTSRTTKMTLGNNGVLALSGGVASTSTATGTLVISGSGGLGVGGQIYAAGIQNTPIGATTPSTGAFTTLSTTGDITNGGGMKMSANASFNFAVTTSVGFHDWNSGLGGTRILSFGADGSTFGKIAMYSSRQNNSGGAYALTINNPSAIQFNGYGAGTLTTDSSGNITATSDARAKDTIGDFTTGLTAIRLLQPRSYRWKPETGLNTEDVNVSLYAQDLIAAGIQEAVFTERTVDQMEDVVEDGRPVRRPRLGPDGRVLTERIPATFYSVSDRAVIAVLVNAVKELAAQVEALALPQGRPAGSPL